MRLRRVTIKSYRSIRDTSFQVARDVTAIVGANESGKSNILRAIEAFSPDRDLQHDDAAQAAPLSDAPETPPVVELTFQDLTERERDAAGRVVRELLVGAASEEAQSVESAIAEKANEIDVSSRDIEEVEGRLALLGPEVESAQAEAQARGKELAEAQLGHTESQAAHADEPTPEREEAVGAASERVQIAAQKKIVADERRNELVTERDGLGKHIENLEESIRSLSRDLEELEPRGAGLQSATQHGESVAKELESAGDLLVRRTGGPELLYELVVGNVTLRLVDRALHGLLNMLPEIVMISSQDLLEESVVLSELQEGESGHKAMRSLLQLGGIENVADLSELGRRPALLRRAEERVANLIRERWTQDQTVGVRLDSDGQMLQLHFTDGTGVTVPPGRRSPGFLEHASLRLVLEASRTSEELQECIILVDELGIRLHPEGQRDFLAILEDLAANNQVIYTTHSPFMIDRNFPDRILLVEKDNDTRTQVNSKPHHERWAPVRSALGMALGDSLLFGDKNVLVEGVSDQLILTAFSQALSHKCLPTVDLNETNFVPVGGAASIMAVATFIQRHDHLEYLILLDSDDEGHRTRKRVEQS